MTPRLTQLGRAIRSFLWLSPPVWQQLFLGQRALIEARREIATRPVGSFVQVTENPPLDAPNVDPQTIRRARFVAAGVVRAAKYLWGASTCLTRSMAIQRRLHDEGIHGAFLRVGVGRRDGAFVAHAWIELDGRVIGDEPTVVQMYTALDGVSVTHFR